NLEIGGRNLLPNTSQDPVLYSKTSWDWNSQRFRLDDLDRLGIDVGTELTLKVYIKNPTQDARAFLQFTSKTPTYRQYYGNYVYEGESGWSTVTIKIAQADLNNFNYLDIAVRGKLSTSGTVELAMKKLEKGNKATDWTPAPEDVDARMTATETTIKQLPDEIDLSVKEGLRGVGNLVKNPELTESTEGWNSGDGLRYMKVTYGEFDGTGALRSETKTNTQTYSEWFDVDPSKAYEVSMWVRKSANRGRWYLG